MTVTPPEPSEAARRRGATNHRLTMQPKTTAAQIHAADRPQRNAAAATAISIHAFTPLADVAERDEPGTEAAIGDGEIRGAVRAPRRPTS